MAVVGISAMLHLMCKYIPSIPLKSADTDVCHGPGWCGSVDWVPACEARVRWVQSLVRAHAWVVGRVRSWGCVRGDRVSLTH